MKNKDKPFPTEALKKHLKEVSTDWAEEFLNSEEGKQLRKELDKDFLNYIVLGKKPYYGDKECFEDLKDYTETTLHLTAAEIIDKFRDTLTETEIKELEDYEK